MNGIQAVTGRLAQLRSERMLSWLTGDYKGYKAASKEFSKLALNNQDAFKNLAPVPKVTVPLFSKTGLKMMKIWFLEKFRIQTPEEKAFKKMAEKEAVKRKFISNI